MTTDRALVVALLVGCTGGGDEGLPDGVGTCPTESALATSPALPSEVLFSGSIPAWPHPDPVMVFTLAGEWEAFRDSRELGTGTTDFATYQVVVGIARSSSTCGLEEEAVEVVRLDGAPHLDLTVVDTSGACDEQCDEDREYLAAAAVPNDAAATACVRVRDECEAR